MEKLFFTVLKMSLISSYVILFVLLIRLLLKRSPKIFSYILWSVVLFRLVCPFSFESKLSLIPNKTILSSQINLSSGLDNINYSNYESSIIDDNIIELDNLEENKNYKVDSNINNIKDSRFKSFNIKKVVAILWITIVAVMISYSIHSLIKLKKHLKDSRLLKENIYEASNIDTAFVIGIFNPRIYIPKGLTNNEEQYIIAHEKIHIKRYDYLIKLISYFVLCIHFFNPLVWIAFIIMSKDMEMSCDEAVMKALGNSIKKEYSKSLLSFASYNKMIKLSPIAFGEGDVKSRIKNVLNYKRPRFWVIIVSIIVIVVVGYGLIFNPLNNNVQHYPYNITEIGESEGVKSTNGININESNVNGSKLPNFKYSGDNIIEKLVYDATCTDEAKKMFLGDFIVVASEIYGSYEEENKIKIFATVYTSSYSYNYIDKLVEEVGGSVIPIAITYVKNNDGTYSLEEYLEAMDGADWAPSIKKFCTMPISGKVIEGLSDRIMNSYAYNENLTKLQRENLIKYLKDNNLKGVSLSIKGYEEPDKIIELT